MISLDSVDHIRHDMAHKLTGLFIDFVGINEDFADFRLEVVADGANNQIAFFNDQERSRIDPLQRSAVDGSGVDYVAFAVIVLRLSCVIDRFPQFKKIIQVPLKLFNASADTGGTSDKAHAFRILKLAEVFFELFSFFAFNAAADAASARIVGH